MGHQGWRKESHHPTSPHRGCPGVPPGDSQLQGGLFFLLQSSATSHHLPVPPGPASPQQLEKKFGGQWRREEKRRWGGNQQWVFGAPRGQKWRWLQDFKANLCPSVTVGAGRRRCRCPPSGLCFQKSSRTRQIRDDGGEERLIPINSQSVINIWASSM